MPDEGRLAEGVTVEGWGGSVGLLGNFSQQWEAGCYYRLPCGRGGGVLGVAVDHPVVLSDFGNNGFLERGVPSFRYDSCHGCYDGNCVCCY